MNCYIQDPTNHTYLSTNGEWTTELRGAMEFTSLGEALRWKKGSKLNNADIIVVRGQGVYRLHEEADALPDHELVPGPDVS